ncbi:PREDICTED: defensin-like protein 182 [Camelina sativa]|uniref:Defensin-like protein n=1 Tax=Camelina sativa TaxID=90675 RepID=A0ABM0UA99_CAMSA|nr:PREDICTED: defensin-like protein 182 [Camelina sativa]
MARMTLRVFIVNLLIIFTSVVDQARAKTCIDGLGTCENCDERCKAKHGPSSESNCGISTEVPLPLCTCYYQCGSSSSPPPSPKKCNGGVGICSQRCPEKCCDMNCAQKYNGGHGFCNTLGTFSLCQCEYPC